MIVPTLKTNDLVTPGQSLGRYRLLAQLGQGGMGAIYLALMSGSGDFEKLVVLKELRADLAQNKEVVQLFLHETKLAGRLSHSNIVQTLEADQIDGRYFLVMEYLDGQPFSELQDRASLAPVVPLKMRLQVICEVLSGLHYAHELKDFHQQPTPIVHCDVSFSNVFVTYDGNVKVIDFGVARAAGKLDQNTGFQGRIRYAAPEQLLNEMIDRRADVFSTGVMLWEAIAQKRFSAPKTHDQVAIEQRLRGEEPPISAVVPHLDPQLAAICERALKVDPKERYASAEEFRLALVSYVSTLGPRMDPSEIGSFMKLKFSSELKKMHDLVNEQLLRCDTSGAIPNAQKRTPGPDDVTTVADLSTFVIATRPTVAPPPTESLSAIPQQSSSRKAAIIGAGAGALVLTGILVLSAGDKGGENGDLNLPAPTLESGDLKALSPSRGDIGKEGANGRHSDLAALKSTHSLTQAAAAGSDEASSVDDRSAPLLDSLPGKKPSSPQASGPTSREKAKEPRSAVGETVKEPETTSTAPPVSAPATTPKKSGGSIFNKSVGGNKDRQRPALDADNPFR